MAAFSQTLVSRTAFPLALRRSLQISSLSLSSLAFSPSLRFRALSKLLSSQSPIAAAADVLDESSDLSDDTVEELLTNQEAVSRLMKMERRPDPELGCGGRWFPYLDLFRSRDAAISSREVIEALDPYIVDSRKERMRRAVEHRSYSVCLVVEGLTDFGNVSAVFRSADALGVQSVHVISSDRKKRCNLF